MRDYKQDIKIDENNLENIWIEQPSLFLYYATAHADALHEKDLAKSKMDYAYAILYSEIKKNWSEYFKLKPTEPAIKEYIIAHSKYRKAEKTLIESLKNVNITLAVKVAFDHRKLALSNLTSLKIGGFYAEPRNKKRDVENMQTAQKKELNTTQNKRKRKTQNN